MLDPIEEEKFAKLRDMCRELKVPAPPEVFVALKVHDKDGALLAEGVHRGHSWTRNFYNMLWSIATMSGGDSLGLFAAGKMSCKITTASIWSGNGPWGVGGDIFYFRGSLSSTASGIVVGTSDAAFSPDQFALQSLCAQGSAANNLLYQADTAPYTVGVYNAVTKTWSFTQSRVMSNNSGATITVKETGIYSTKNSGYGRDNIFGGGAAGGIILMERTVLPTPYVVPFGANLTVLYTTYMDFSAID